MHARARRWTLAFAGAAAVLVLAVAGSSLYANSESGRDRCYHALVVEAHLDEAAANRVDIKTRGWSWVPLGVRCVAVTDGNSHERIVGPW